MIRSSFTNTLTCLPGRFSRDDSIGGPHNIGDPLDPRVAWSEGWANFFSSAVRGTSIYLDSKGPGIPTDPFRQSRRTFPPSIVRGIGARPQWQAFLWDLVDENADKDDLLPASIRSGLERLHRPP
jgi:hypothetical protein